MLLNEWKEANYSTYIKGSSVPDTRTRQAWSTSKFKTCYGPSLLSTSVAGRQLLRQVSQVFPQPFVPCALTLKIGFHKRERCVTASVVTILWNTIYMQLTSCSYYIKRNNGCVVYSMALYHLHSYIHICTTWNDVAMNRAGRRLTDAG